MTLIVRKLQRDLWTIRGRVVTLVLIIASGVGVAFGIPMALTSLLSTQDEIFRRQAFADLEIQLLPEDVNNLPALAKVASVQTFETRLVLPARIALPRGGRDLAGLLVLQDEPAPALNQRALLAGRNYRPGGAEVVVDKALADYHGVGVGDELEVSVGQKRQRYTVTGVALSPEFLVTSSNPDYVIAEPGSLGVMWSDSRPLADVLGFSMVNSLLLQYRPGVTRDKGLADVVAALGDKPIERLTPRDESYSYKAVRMDVEAFRVYSPAIVVTLAALALAMGVITFRRFVVERQREFGVVVALGYRRSTLRRALASSGLRLGLVGGALGVAIGLGLSWAFAEVYAKAMHLPMVIHSFDWKLGLTSLVGGGLTGVLALSVAAWPTLSATPRELLSPRGDLGGKSTHAFARWPLAWRLGLRGLAVERGLSLASVLAMAGSVAVAIAYGLAMTSTLGTVENSFDRERWQYAVDFQYPMYDDEAAQLLSGDGASPAQPYFRTAADMRRGERHTIGVLVGAVPGGALQDQRPAQGRAIARDGEVVVSVDLARDLGLQLGERFDVVKGGLTEPVTVVGLTNDIFLRTVTLSLAQVQRLAQAEGKISGGYVNASPAWRDRVAGRTDLVARVTDKQRLVEHFRGEIGGMMGIVYITIAFSVGVSILFVTTLVYLAIAERRGEFAVLRSLGLSRGRLRATILSSVAAQVLLALAAAVPLAIALVSWLNQRMGQAWFAVQLHAQPTDFVWPMLAAAVVAPIVGWLGMRAIAALDIPQYLKGRAT